MTLCAAAICTNHPPAGPVQCLLCISDRMLTSGDIEFESGTSKVFGFSPANAVALVSGDHDAHIEIAQQTHRQVIDGHIENVRQIADFYAENLMSFRTRRAERFLLAPLGMDLDSFIARQQEMEPSLAQELASRLLGEEQDIGIETIVAGIDSSGVHLYRVSDPGIVDCCDGSGFVAVGSGARQFETQFMAASYTAAWPIPSAVMLMYGAKKRAEVSPGVGRATDLVANLGRDMIFTSPVGLEALERYYQELEKAIQDKKLELTHRLIAEGNVFKANTPAIQQASLGEIKSLQTAENPCK